MASKISIPEELQGAFQRLMRLLPDELRDNQHLQETTMVFLKFGGEMLARNNVEINKIHYKEEIRLIKKR